MKNEGGASPDLAHNNVYHDASLILASVRSGCCVDSVGHVIKSGVSQNSDLRVRFAMNEYMTSWEFATLASITVSGLPGSGAMVIGYWF